MANGSVEVVFVDQQQIDVRVTSKSSEASAPSTWISLGPESAGRLGRSLILAAGCSVEESGYIASGTVIHDGKMIVETAEIQAETELGAIAFTLSLAHGLALRFILDPVLASDIVTDLQRQIGASDRPLQPHPRQ